MEDSTRIKRGWAVALARQGFRIFPLRPGTKGGHYGSWKELATTDVAQIDAWFDNDPDINYGVNPSDGQVVLDLDRKPGEADGLQAFESLAADEGDFIFSDGADTLTVQTPSGGGIHLYLTTPYPVGNSDTHWPEGINVRGVGGYVVGPGSEVDEGEGKAQGTYKVIRNTLPIEAPAWAVRRFRKGGERSENADTALFEQDTEAAITRARDFLSRRKPAIEGNGGDQHTLVTIMHLRDYGLSEDKALEMMVEPDGWNDRCDPPWDIEELETKVYNAFKYAKNQPGHKGVDWADDPDLVDISTIAHEQYQSESQTEGPNTKEKLREIFFRGGGIAKRNKRREMIIPEWLPAHGLIALLAKRGMGKTVSLVDMACRISLKAAEDDGMTWMGQPIAKDFAVIYICGEDDEGLEEQLRAWMRINGKTLPEDRFFTMAGTVDLMSADSVRMWVEFLKEQLGGRRAVVVVDTWQRASSRGGQNKDEDMQTAVAHIEAIAKAFNGPAIAAFHPPKHDTNVVMGSSIIENSTTAIWEMSDSNGARRLEVTRIKGKGIGNYQLFEFEEVDLEETDAFGKPRSGVVAKQIGGAGESSAAVMAAKTDRLRRNVAESIRQLENFRNWIDAEGAAQRKLTPNTVDHYIGQDGILRKEWGKDSEQGEWAAKVLDPLKESDFLHKRYRDKLSPLFKNHPFYFESGYLLTLVEKNARHSFFQIEKTDVFTPEDVTEAQ